MPGTIGHDDMIQRRGFGHGHHGNDNRDMSLSDPQEYQHIASILSIVTAGITVLGAVAIMIRALQTPGVCIGPRTRKQQSSDTEGAKLKGAGSEKDGDTASGAKRLRRQLCIALLFSDACVAISWLAPAAMDLKDQPLHGDQCQMPGLTLATALWWQYGFSLAIAVSTFLALRYPLSSAKRWQERKVGIIICVILALGIVQALVWKQAHGYTNWGQFCYYGSPRSRIAEAMQFLPRLFSSFLIAVIYIVLVHFLRRPDLTARYTSPSPPPPRRPRGASADTLCGSDRHLSTDKDTTDDIPPWEKMVLPDFGRMADEEKVKSPPLGSRSRLATPDRAWLKSNRLGRHERYASSSSDTTLTPSVRPSTAIAVRLDFSPKSPLTSTFGSSAVATTLKRHLRPSTAPSTTRAAATPPLLAPVPIQPTLSLPISIERELSCGSFASESGGREVASFRGMMFGSASGDSEAGDRPRTPPPIDATGMVESRASVLNRRTWKVLIWFPLTVSCHRLVTCCQTDIAR